MEEISKMEVSVAEPRKGRKKIADRSTWKREKAKVARHKPKTPPKMPTCRHGFKKRKFCCSDLTVQDVGKFHRSFYAHADKIKQDTLLLKYCVPETPKRIGVASTANKKGQTIKYYVPKSKLTPRGRRVELVQVCQKAFTTILGISKDRIQRICKNNMMTMALPKENRGGDRKSAKYADRKDSVKQFILGLKALESHYVRGRSKVQYLTSDLSIRKLHKIYNETQDHAVKYEFFRRIFTIEFNLSFKSPATDACSKCAELKEIIKVENDPGKKVTTMAELRIHKLKGKWFYKNLGFERDNEITFTFDCQKNLPVPKLPDQAAYFTRQLYVYNLTISQGSSRAPQTPSNTFIYTWLESEAPKGSNQIASAVYHRLTNTTFTENISHVRLMCDGCGGQNKNSVVLGMLLFWLKEQAPAHIKKITIYFPIVGHSFLPPDRVFGNIERQIRQKEIILTPDEYYETFRGFGTVLRLGQDFDFYDWKSSVKSVLKIPGSWHFQFNLSKRFMIRKDRNNRIAVKGEPNYVADTINFGNVFKTGKTASDIEPTKLNVGAQVKPAKLQDINKLLVKHFGIEWRNREFLHFFLNLLATDDGQLNDIPDHEENTVMGPVSDNSSTETDDENTLMEEISDVRI